MKLILKPINLPQIRVKHPVPATIKKAGVPAVVVKVPTALMVI